MIRKKREIIFSAELEYGYQLRNKGIYLRKDSRDSNVDFDRLERDVRNVIIEQLPSELKNIFGIDVRIRILGTRYGSLSVFFGAIVAGYGIIAGYKGFYDSIQLLKSQCDSLITHLLRSRYTEDIEVGVSIEYPRLPEPDFNRLPRRLRKAFGPMAEELAEFLSSSESYNFNRDRRDGFFWYLLVINVVLFAIVAILAGGAVMKVYFP